MLIIEHNPRHCCPQNLWWLQGPPAKRKEAGLGPGRFAWRTGSNCYYVFFAGFLGACSDLAFANSTALPFTS